MRRDLIGLSNLHLHDVRLTEFELNWETDSVVAEMSVKNVLIPIYLNYHQTVIVRSLEELSSEESHSNALFRVESDLV